MSKQKQSTAVGTKFIGMFGNWTVIRFEHPYRIDEYTSNDAPDESYTDQAFAVDKYDATPIHRTYPTGYDSRCNTCWLGYGHTEAYHAASIAKYEAQSKATA